MNFDIKDVKSWHNRHDVKVGDEGYCADSIEDLKTENIRISNDTFKIKAIVDVDAFCFCTELSRFSFFLPLDAVKEDKPKEKRYRPFEDAYELYKFLLPNTSLTRKDFSNKLLLNFPITYRKRDTQNFTTTELITSVEVAVINIDNCPLNIININRKDLKYWFANYEIMNSKGEWLPFGVEVKEND